MQFLQDYWIVGAILVVVVLSFVWKRRQGTFQKDHPNDSKLKKCLSRILNPEDRKDPPFR